MSTKVIALIMTQDSYSDNLNVSLMCKSKLVTVNANKVILLKRGYSKAFVSTSFKVQVVVTGEQEHSRL
jgi:hypothetical protein